MDNQELKTKYSYITEEQWASVDLGEAEYTNFLNKEDKEALEVEYLAQAKAEKENAQAYIISQLNEIERLPTSQLIVAGAKVLQAWFYEKTGKYIGHNIMHFFVQYQELRGLRIYAMSYETPKGDRGYNLNFTYTHPDTGWKFTRTISGEGVEPQDQEWSNVNEEL